VTHAVLVLADGATFEGEAIGAALDEDVATGEIVFNTALAGYQEILTDPSYAGQIITFTYPHIGNYGVNADDNESARPHCAGVVVRDLARRPSSWRADGTLSDFLERHGLAGIAGIDTRRLTRHLRSVGALPAAFGTDEVAVRSAAGRATGTDGIDLVAGITTRVPYTVGDAAAPYRVVAYDYGIKSTILRHLTAAGCQVEVVPATTPADAVVAREPDGVFLSNGPGDPVAVMGAADTVARLLGEVPVFGICLGHQILGLAAGASTHKLHFGHHGANHPVRHEPTGQVEITSQNHNYAVDLDPVGDAEVTHVNLNDGVCEGFRLRSVPAFGVQYHPEAGPGPHDARYLFGLFLELMDRDGGAATEPGRRRTEDRVR
jgi:carbamoyl-phosphate synthase small subunit